MTAWHFANVSPTRGPESNFEFDVLEECHDRGLHPLTTTGLMVTREGDEKPVKTMPDQFYVFGTTRRRDGSIWPKRFLAVYIDGPPHLTARQEEKDERARSRLADLEEVEVLPIAFQHGTEDELLTACDTIEKRVRLMASLYGPCGSAPTVGFLLEWRDST